MKFEDHLRACLLSFPSIYPTALRVYDHLFIVNGNGYEWIDGELVSDSDYCFNVEDAVVKNINFTLVENNAFLKRMMSVSDNILEKTVERMIEESIKPLFHVEERMKDFTIPEWFNERGRHTDDNRFMFYDLSKYSKLYTIPDNIKDDWLKAAKKMVDILDKNPDKFKDREGIFEQVKERINKLYKERFLF